MNALALAVLAGVWAAVIIAGADVSDAPFGAQGGLVSITLICVLVALLSAAAPRR